MSLLDTLDISATKAISAPIAKKYPRPRRLLLVEDYEDTRRTFARILRARGFEVAESRSISEASIVLSPALFCCPTLDCRMAMAAI
jgi:ActR/RegA family two-component response regulator